MLWISGHVRCSRRLLWQSYLKLSPVDEVSHCSGVDYPTVNEWNGMTLRPSEKLRHQPVIYTSKAFPQI